MKSIRKGCWIFIEKAQITRIPEEQEQEQEQEKQWVEEFDCRMEGEAPKGEPDDESLTVSGKLTLVPSIAR